ncbi:MAG: hypothetical protein methR_P1101 [Methyloprofundus sp.]|nr:MAG: hypothetical protein methR_P1101 [Methyloprofundus sp.]
MAKKSSNKRKARNKRRNELARGVDAVISKEAKDTYYLSTYNITYEPITKEVNKLPKNILKQMDELNFQIYNEPQEAIPKLLVLKDKYPDAPILYNYLAKAYGNVRDFAAMEEVCIENYANNPSYLFAKINYAQMCLNKRDYEKVAEIFDNKFDLKLLYPDRNEFHITEFEGFTGVMCEYYYQAGESDAAKLSYDALKEVSPDSLIFKRVHSLFYPGMIVKFLRKLLNKKAAHKLQA